MRTVDFENFVQIESTDFEKIPDEVFPIAPSGDDQRM